MNLTGVYIGQPTVLLSELGFEDLEIYDDIIIEEDYKKTNIKYADYNVECVI